MLVVTEPPVPKVLSGTPLVVKRARTDSSLRPPATRIAPCACSAAAAAPPISGLYSTPPMPKEESRLPSGLYRASARMDTLGPADPTTTILPSVWSKAVVKLLREKLDMTSPFMPKVWSKAPAFNKVRPSSASRVGLKDASRWPRPRKRLSFLGEVEICIGSHLSRNFLQPTLRAIEKEQAGRRFATRG